MMYGLDLGFGYVKGIDGDGKTISFPSAIGDFQPVRYTSEISKGSPMSNMVIRYNQTPYFVGESALKQSRPQYTIDRDRTVSDEGMILLSGALDGLLNQVSLIEPLYLVLGLPVLHYSSDFKDKYINVVKQINVIERLSTTGDLISRKYISPTEVKVLPQPMGTFFDCVLDNEGNLSNRKLASGKVGIIDIGYNTLDLAWVDCLEFSTPLSTSYSGLGMFSTYQNISQKIYQSLGIEIQVDNIESQIRKGEISISGRTHSIESLINEAFNETARQIISRVKSLWREHRILDQIIISGGGGMALGNYLLDEFPQAYIANNSMFANVAGYLKFGKRVWRT